MSETDREKGEGGAGKNGSGSGGKAKDLSHVPCKFFRVGGCTAGAACPFSHSSAPGEKTEKDVCAWFVKGNCKFGHKCALAHILPGQGMNMDRRNKKAAQVAASKSKGERAHDGDRSARGRGRGKGLPITMSLKASISPSAPAPALRDADFGAGNAGGAMSSLSEKMREMKMDLQPTPTPPPVEVKEEEEEPAKKEETKLSFANAAKGKLSESKPGVPVSTPRMATSPAKPPVDFGPIGSPPRSWGAKGSFSQSPRVGGLKLDTERGEDPEGEGGEMFLPGSLSDLLTADELARRRSAGGGGGVSRSVPAPSLLSGGAPPGLTLGSAGAHPPLPLPVGEGIWASPPPSAYVNLAPSNASGAFLQSAAVPRRYLANGPGPLPTGPTSFGDSYGGIGASMGGTGAMPGVTGGGGIGMSLPQGLAAGYSRIHARPMPGGTPSSFGAGSILDTHHLGTSLSGRERFGAEGGVGSISGGFSSGPWGVGGAQREKSREWGASSYGTGAGSFGGSPVSASFFGHHSQNTHHPSSSFSATGGLAGSFKDRPMFSPDRASFSRGERDRFVDRQAGIREEEKEAAGVKSGQDDDDDLFVLDG